MPICRVALEFGSAAFQRSLKKLSRKYPKIIQELNDAASQIEANYEDNRQFPVPVRKFRRAVWEYSFGSADMRKHARESFRFYGVFLPDTPDVMYPLIVIWKGINRSPASKRLNTP